MGGRTAFLPWCMLPASPPKTRWSAALSAPGRAASRLPCSQAFLNHRLVSRHLVAADHDSSLLRQPLGDTVLATAQTSCYRSKDSAPSTPLAASDPPTQSAAAGCRGGGAELGLCVPLPLPGEELS